jgi:hypothetical protein
VSRSEKSANSLKTPLYSWRIAEVLRAFRANQAVTWNVLDNLQLAYEEYWYSPVLFSEVLDFMEIHGLSLFESDEPDGGFWNPGSLPKELKTISTVWLNTNFYINIEEELRPKLIIGSLTTFEPATLNRPIGDFEHFELGTFQDKPVTKLETKQVTPKRRYEVLVRDEHTCQSCGAKAPNTLLQVDHIFPRSLGGSNDLENLQTLCVICNIGKGATYQQ